MDNSFPLMYFTNEELEKLDKDYMYVNKTEAEQLLKLLSRQYIDHIEYAEVHKLIKRMWNFIGVK